MLTTITVAVLSAIIIYAFSQYRALQRNIAVAKASGFAYVISPVFFQSIPWIILQESLLPLLTKLPQSWTDSWLPLSLFYRIWHSGYTPFEKASSDTILHVSPGGNVLWTCNPELITHVFSRHKDFLKPTEMLALLNIYGPTITASEGPENQMYRKVAAPSFGENTHRLVWDVSLVQAGLMLEIWGKEEGYVPSIDVFSNRFALHVLSAVFFDKTMVWSGEDNDNPPPGHALTYTDAISTAFKSNETLFMTPPLILST